MIHFICQIYTFQLETPQLGEDQLQDLIDQCVTSLSHTSMSRMTLNSESRTSFADAESVASHSIDGTVDGTPRLVRAYFHYSFVAPLLRSASLLFNQ